MEAIYTIHIFAEYMREGEETIKLPPEDRSWIDSYWTDEATALKEAEKIWREDMWECFSEIVVFERKLNVSGEGENAWKSCDRVVKRFHA